MIVNDLIYGPSATHQQVHRLLHEQITRGTNARLLPEIQHLITHYLDERAFAQPSQPHYRAGWEIQSATYRTLLNDPCSCPSRRRLVFVLFVTMLVVELFVCMLLISWVGGFTFM